MSRPYLDDPFPSRLAPVRPHGTLSPAEAAEVLAAGPDPVRVVTGGWLVADWDLSRALATVRAARAVSWVARPGRVTPALAVITVDGRALNFEVNQ